MPTTTQPRKWTATVSVAGQDATPLLELPPTSDTLKATTDAAKKLAADLIRNEYGSDASVVIFKQLARDAEPRRDRSHYVYRDEDGSIKSMFNGA